MVHCGFFYTRKEVLEVFQLVDFVGSWWSLWVPALLVVAPVLRVVSSEARGWVSEVREWVQMNHERGRESRE